MSAAAAQVTADWVAVDWGTSNLRAWAMDDGGAPRAHAASHRGMAGLAPEDFEPALVALVTSWLRPEARTAVVACGMVGARQGWADAGYASVPCPPAGARPATRPAVADPRLAVYILPGVCQAAPADVMRGEETQIAGLLARNPRFDGVVCLPGTHSKWVHVSAGEIVSFASFMTGELFGLLSERSVLRHGLDGAGFSEPDFDAAVDDALSHPERLAGRLFSLRAENLLAGLEPDRARARLSGLLIGAELAAARPYWLGRDIALVGARGLAERYARALSAQGIAPTAHDAEALTLAGLAAAYAHLLTEGAIP